MACAGQQECFNSTGRNLRPTTACKTHDLLAVNENRRASELRQIGLDTVNRRVGAVAHAGEAGIGLPESGFP